jgi:hypothetical protein
MKTKKRMLAGTLLATVCLTIVSGQMSFAQAPAAANASAPTSTATASLSPVGPSGRPRQAALPKTTAAASAITTVDTKSQDAAGANVNGPKFTSEGKWELAGYNNDEVVYTVFVTSQDTRIIRCTTEIKGFYFENGTKMSIADRQITTVFPNQPTRVGYWMDMDQQSGATYAVKCHPV